MGVPRRPLVGVPRRGDAENWWVWRNAILTVFGGCGATVILTVLASIH
jgi:hypothetical protein